MSPADWELAKANTLAIRNPSPLDHDAQVASLLASVVVGGAWRRRGSSRVGRGS